MRGSHGLSARRTLSSRPEGPKAGPKGRSLEVGARMAPRPRAKKLVKHQTAILWSKRVKNGLKIATKKTLKINFFPVNGGGGVVQYESR